MSKEGRSDFKIYLVVVFILLLFVPQFYAFILQFVGGFTPFKTEPRRIHLSWDMFSTKVERCVLTWSPAIHLGRETLSGLRDASLPLEWDLTFDHVLDYRNVANLGCNLGGLPQTKIKLKCFEQEGKITHEEFTCR